MWFFDWIRHVFKAYSASEYEIETTEEQKEPAPAMILIIGFAPRPPESLNPGGFLNNGEPVRFVRCQSCGQDGQFYQGRTMINGAISFGRALLVYDQLAPLLTPENREELRASVLAADFLEGYKPEVQDPDYLTPGERRPYT